MRKFPIVVALLLVALVGVLWYLGSLDGASEISPQEVVANEGATPATLEVEPPAELESPSLESEDRSEIVEQTADEEAPGATYPRSRIFGVVTDESNRPLSGIRVTMSAQGRWTSEELYPEDLPTFETETSSIGAFEFDTPLPTSDWVWLSIQPTEFYVRAGRDFGPAGGRDEEPVREGDNDLGTIVLQTAGAFEGTVLGADGLAVEKVRVRLDGVFPGGYSAGAGADAGGRYRVGGVPQGTYDVEALAKGFVTSKQSGVRVENGEITPGVDFQLQRAPSISGRVIDEDGNGLARVRLWGWPESAGQGAGARTTEDGRFEIFLPQREPYTLEAELAGFEKFESGYQRLFAPGTDDIEIVLEKLNLVTYRVRNAVTNEPIERFGLKIIQVRTESGTRGSSAHREPARIQDHPGGEAQKRGHPKFDDYTIVAPGYGAQRGDVDFDEERTQTILLAPAGSISGRFVHADEGVGGATIRIEADRIPLKPGVTEGEDDIFSDDWGTDLDEFAGQRRQHRTESDGTFLITDLAAGTYELQFTSNGVAPKVVDRVVVESGVTTKLGDVQAVAPSELHGTIVLVNGIPVSGLTVSLGSADFADRESERVTDVSGRFVFENLRDGKHYVWVEPKQRVLLPGKPVEVELGAAETREVELDLSDRVPCQLTVQVLVNGEPFAGARIEVEPGIPPAVRHRVGSTDADGLVTGDSPRLENGTIRVLSKQGLVIGDHGPISLQPGGERRVAVAFEPGRLRVKLPLEHSQVDPDASNFFLNVRPSDRERIRWSRARSIESSLVEGQLHLDLGSIAEGSYALALQYGSGTRLSGQVVVNAGSEATCELEE